VAREAGAIDNAAYRALNKVDTLAASAALRRLRDAGLLQQKGRGSATYYVPAERLGLADKQGEAGAGSALSGNPPALSTKLGGLSSNPGGLSSNPGALSSNPPAAEQDAARTALLDALPAAPQPRGGAAKLPAPAHA
jgi:ATP-dependent DNA helicase RecG